MTLKIIVTGVFGNVGQHVLTELVNQGHDVIAYDIKNDRTEKKMKELSYLLSFTTIWGDLTNEDNVKNLISEQKPDAIAHVAAVIAPTAYVIPNIAYKVNVLGTKYLIEAAKKVENFSRFVFVSSYSVHGPRNPYKDLPPLTGDSSVNPGDNYGKHKIAGEKMLEESGLDWTVIRLPAVFSTDSDFGAGDEFMKFGFMLDPDRYQSAIDARDAGLAIANAITADSVGRKFDICGDPAKGWTGRSRDLTGPLIQTSGLSPFPDSAYRRSDPEVDESWYYEGIVDPTEPQKILKFQRSSFEEYLQFKRKQAGFSRYLIKLFSPLIKRSLVKKSKYHVEGTGIHSGSVWEDIKQDFGLNEDELIIFNE